MSICKKIKNKIEKKILEKADPFSFCSHQNSIKELKKLSTMTKRKRGKMWIRNTHINNTLTYVYLYKQIIFRPSNHSFWLHFLPFFFRTLYTVFVPQLSSYEKGINAGQLFLTLFLYYHLLQLYFLLPNFLFSFSSF